jgi:uncharacterized protein
LIRFLVVAAALFFIFAGFSPAAEFPALTGRVVDAAGVLSPAAQGRLSAELEAHEARTKQQIVVATIKSLNGQSIEDYGVALGRAWGIGQKGSNTGAILLVAPADHKVRIEVGYGLEGDLTDAASAAIINGIILPHFRQNDIQGGVVAGTEAVLRTLGDPLTGPVVVRRPQPQGHGSILSIVLTFLAFAVFMFFARHRSGGGGLGSGMILPLIIGGSLGGRGGGSFGGDSGGGFSGGGGSFGGGGASGSW